jgi:RND family efflux transporter MFP subunit
MLGGLATVGALMLAGYGLWIRSAALQDLQKMAKDSAVPRVAIINPRPGPTVRSVTLPGNVAAWNQAPIFAQVSGYVTQWYKDYGAHVDEGEVLAEIAAPGLDAQYAASRSQLEAAVSDYNLAEVTARRYIDLKNSPAVSQQQIDNYVAAATAAKAQMEAARANVARYAAMIGFEKVTAPFAGLVTARLVNIGDYVNAAGGDAVLEGSAKPLFTVADVSKLRVYVAVPQNLGGALSPGLKATLSFPNAPERMIDADFLTMAGAVDPASRTIVTELMVADTKGGLFPGTYVDVHLSFPGAPNILIVPSQALLFRADGMQVATVDAHDMVRLQNVVLGENLGLDIQIVSGLSPNDRIVANPSLGLLDGQEVKVVLPAQGAESPASSRAP